MDPRALPARPPSEVEWEELLVRLDVAPRAIRLAVEDAADTPALRSELASALVGERLYGVQLDALRTGEPVVDLFASVDPDPGLPSTEALAVGLAELRSRTFARVQRRGIDVWEWCSPVRQGGTLTAYQLLQAMTHADADLLSRIRMNRCS
jgi:hypothetical protein